MTVSAIAGQTIETDLISIYGQSEVDKSDNGLDKDAFLKLLVAQLKYQDPLDPSSSAEFIATTAQFTVVEKLQELTEQGAADQKINALSTATALIGKEISVKDADGVTHSAVVRRTELANGEVTVVTDIGSVSLDQILSIGPPSEDSETSTTETSTTETSTTDSSTTDNTEVSGTGASTDSSASETSSSLISNQATETSGTDAAQTATAYNLGGSPETKGNALSMSKLNQFAYAKYGISASKTTVSNKES